MSEYSVAGPELRNLLKAAKKGPISFAFNPGKNAEDHMLGLHKLRSPDALGLSIKKSGAGPKVCKGTCLVDGKLLKLTTEEPLPGVARKMKAFLKLNKVVLNVVLLAPDGSVLEQEIEELPPDAEAEGPEEAAGEDTGPDSAPPEITAPEPAPDQTAALTRRLSALQPGIKAAPEAQRTELVGAFTQIAGQIKTRDFAAAATGLDRLEARMATAGTETAPDPRLDQLRKDHAATLARVAEIADPATKTKLAGALAIIGKMIDAGQADTAAEGLRKLEAALPKPQDSQPPADLSALRSRLRDLAGRIGAVGDEAARRNLAGLANAVNQALKAEDATAAALALEALGTALNAAPGPQKPRKPLLPIWRDARDDTNAQLIKLQDALRSHGMPLFQRIADKGLNGITEKQLVALQVSLMNADTAEGGARAQADTKLRSAMAEMRAFLSTNPALPLLERNPLNVPISVRATLGAALDQIDQALAS